MTPEELIEKLATLEAKLDAFKQLLDYNVQLSLVTLTSVACSIVGFIIYNICT
jgi:hypothetical protein